jgi:hypothetical protein
MVFRSSAVVNCFPPSRFHRSPLQFFASHDFVFFTPSVLKRCIFISQIPSKTCIPLAMNSHRLRKNDSRNNAVNRQPAIPHIVVQAPSPTVGSLQWTAFRPPQLQLFALRAILFFYPALYRNDSVRDLNSLAKPQFSSPGRRVVCVIPLLEKLSSDGPPPRSSTHIVAPRRIYES